MNSKITIAVAGAVMSALTVVSATAQVVTVTNFDTRNFNTNVGYVRAYSIIATNQPAGIRWSGNDIYNPTTDYGETDTILRMVGYTPGASGIGNSSLVQGGLYSGDGIFPGTSDVKLWKSFTPTASGVDSVLFTAQWSLIGSLDGSYPDLDTFAFDLRTADNSASLLRLDLTPGIATIPNGYTLQSIVGTNAPVNRVDLGYQAVYEISVQMSGGLYNMSLAQLNPSNQTVITNVNLVTGAALNSGFTAGDFGTVGLDWELSSGVNTDPGSNYIIVNNFRTTTTGTPIPEAGTWVAGILLASLVGLRLKRRIASQVS
jgi:hypothetical protein